MLDTKLIARIEVAFGVVGLVTAATAQVLFPRAISALAYTVSGAFLALVLYAGRELARGTRRGLALSALAQALQVVHLNLNVIGLLVLGGPSIELGASQDIVQVTGRAGAVASLTFSPIPFARLPGLVVSGHLGFLLNDQAQSPEIAVGVNLLALVLAVRLFMLWRQARRRARNAQATLSPAA